MIERGSKPVYADTMAQTSTTPTKRLVLRAVLTEVNPQIARVVAVPDDLEFTDLRPARHSLKLEWSKAHFLRCGY